VRTSTDAEPALRWLLLVHQIPPKPDYFRVKVRRRLQKLGALPIKNSVYVLPLSDQALEDFQWVAREIAREGGEAALCDASFVAGLSDDDLRDLFRAASDAEYAGVTRDVKALRAESEVSRLAHEVARLKKRIAAVGRTDFFEARGRVEAEAGIESVARRARATPPVPKRASVRGDTAPGRTWVTRDGVRVDRIASAWLIRRFIDPKARFKFVPAKGYVPRAGEVRFDMFEAEYTHEGDRCTFETLVARFGLRDRALRALGEIVHDIDCKDEKFGRAEAAGVALLIAGITRATDDDTMRLERGGVALDDLYGAVGRRAV
jgi:hypothetical protein